MCQFIWITIISLYVFIFGTIFLSSYVFRYPIYNLGILVQRLLRAATDETKRNRTAFTTLATQQMKQNKKKQNQTHPLRSATEKTKTKRNKAAFSTLALADRQQI